MCACHDRSLKRSSTPVWALLEPFPPSPWPSEVAAMCFRASCECARGGRRGEAKEGSGRLEFRAHFRLVLQATSGFPPPVDTLARHVMSCPEHLPVPITYVSRSLARSPSPRARAHVASRSLARSLSLLLLCLPPFCCCSQLHLLAFLHDILLTLLLFLANLVTSSHVSLLALFPVQLKIPKTSHSAVTVLAPLIAIRIMIQACLSVIARQRERERE